VEKKNIFRNSVRRLLRCASQEQTALAVLVQLRSTPDHPSLLGTADAVSSAPVIPGRWFLAVLWSISKHGGSCLGTLFQCFSV